MNYGLRIAEIGSQDGTSNTIAFNELRVGINPGDRRGMWAMGRWRLEHHCQRHATGDCSQSERQRRKVGRHRGLHCAARQIGKPSVGMGDMRMGCSFDNAPMNWPNWQAQARSLHPGGVLACFADCSTRFITNNIATTELVCRPEPEDGQANRDF